MMKNVPEKDDLFARVQYSSEGRRLPSALSISYEPHRSGHAVTSYEFPEVGSRLGIVSAKGTYR